MEILIFRMKYPNDCTNNISAHQHFLCNISNDKIEVYTISSIVGKEKRVFNIKYKENYERIESNEISKYGLTTPSFIDCTKRYDIGIDKTINLNKLSKRTVPEDLKNRLLKRINDRIKDGSHKIYNIPLSDFVKYNPIIKI